MRPKILIPIAVCALALTACSSPAEPGVSPEPTASATPAQPAQVKSLSMGSGEVSTEATSSEDPSMFLKSIELRWAGELSYTEEQLFDAGRNACDQMKDGSRTREVVTPDLEGISADNQHALAVAAKDGLCRELIPDALDASEIPDRRSQMPSIDD